MNSRDKLATVAASAALRLRTKYGLGLLRPICAVDLALKVGIEVRFEPIASLEGIYSAELPQTIVLSTLRPKGRRAFTCAHEIAHHLFQHGSRVELVEAADRLPHWDEKEYLADRFAASLLMPKIAIRNSFVRRGWTPEDCTPEQIYTIAHSFGVGFTTLIRHLERTLFLLSVDQGRNACDVRCCLDSELRSPAAKCRPDLVPVDQQWGSQTLDLEVGDLVIANGNFKLKGACVESLCSTISLISRKQ